MANTSRNAVANLGIRDTEDLAEYLLYHIGSELRGKLMAERPVLYSRLYPNIDPVTLAFKVSAAIHQEKGTPVR